MLPVMYIVNSIYIQFIRKFYNELGFDTKSYQLCNIDFSLILIIHILEKEKNSSICRMERPRN